MPRRDAAAAVTRQYRAVQHRAVQHRAVQHRAVLALAGPVSRYRRSTGGVVATLYSGPLPEGNCGAARHEARWSFVLTGDLNGGTHGDATVPWRQVASEVVSYLRGRSLPGDHGYMESDIAGDGLHTGTYWQRGRDVYVASTYHGTLPALALAVAMASYPSGAGGGRPSNRRSRRP